MITLLTNFVSGAGGFAANPLTYKQLKRTAKVAIYERSRDGVPFDYEVFKIKVVPKGTQIFKTVTEDDEEKYPGSSQFGGSGCSAWPMATLTSAMAKYNELIKETDDTAEIEPQRSIVVPVGEFTIAEFGDKNSIKYPQAFLIIKAALANGSVKLLREERRNARGKATKIFVNAAKTS
jgi:hypothetical protein